MNEKENVQKPVSESNANDVKKQSDESKRKVDKPPKLEDKPFQAFIEEDFIPGLSRAFKSYGLTPSIVFEYGSRPVVGDSCWIVKGEINKGRRFWLCFSSEKITSNKTITLAEPGSEPSLLESFLLDEKKITLKLITSRFLQRLNGQKWLGNN